MRRSRIQASTCALLGAAAIGLSACTREAPPPPPKATITAGDAIAGRVGTFEHFESVGGHFGADFPPVWRNGYASVERADTTGGARFVVEFLFKPDPAWKVAPKTLLAVRVFQKAAWDRLVAKGGPAMAAKVAERGDDVFAVSLPPSNPYKPGTPAATRFDEMVLAVAQDPAVLRLTPR